jgi:hypothetical protein
MDEKLASIATANTSKHLTTSMANQVCVNLK